MERSKEEKQLQETCDQFINNLRGLLKTVPKAIAYSTCILVDCELNGLRRNYEDYNTDRNDPWVKKIQETALRVLGRELDEDDMITVLDELCDQEPDTEIEDIIIGWFGEDAEDDE